MTVEFPFARLVLALGSPPDGGDFVALLVVLMAIVFVGRLRDAEPLRPALVGTGSALLAWAAAVTTDGLALVLIWSAIGLVTLEVAATGMIARARRAGTQLPSPDLREALRLLGRAPVAAGLVPIGLAAAATFDLLLDAWLQGPPGLPFLVANGAGAATLAVIAVALVGACVSTLPVRRTLLAGALLLLALAAPLQLPMAWAVAAWSALAAAAVAYGRWDRERGAPALGGALLLLLAGVEGTLVVLGPAPFRVSAHDVRLAPFLTDATVALVALSAGVIATSRAIPRSWARGVGAGVAGSLVVVALSVGVVDLFSVAARASPHAVAELAKGSQVALSVVWTVLGLGLLAVGLAARRLEVRLSGIALLALASAKVFLVDMAALDVAYRVMSLLALGALLLAGAYVSLRFRSVPPAVNGESGT
jgi:uncharacterized membrane protein